MQEYEQELVKVYHKCGRYKKVSPDVAQAFEDNPETFECILCTRKDGKIRSTRTYVQCGVCLQLCDPLRPGEASKCFCPPDKSKIIGIVNTEAKRMYEDVETGKTHRLLVNKVNKARVEPLKVAKENNELLKELISLMKPKKQEIKITKVNHGAVQ